MTVQRLSHDDVGLHDRMRIADDTTTTRLDALARPMGRSALSVAAIVTAEALSTTTGATDPVARGATDTWTPLARIGEESLLALLLDADLDGGHRPGTPTGEPPVIELGGRPADPLWSITRDEHGITLRYDRDRPGGVDPGAVAERARRLLSYLAEPGTSSRWTQPLPKDGGGAAVRPPQALRRRWRSRRAQETAAATALLTRWLHLDELPRAGVLPEHWWAHLGLTPELRPLLSTWCRWLRSQGLLDADEDTLLPDGPALTEARRRTRHDTWEEPVTSIVGLLDAHERLIRDVLTGHAPTTCLLDIPELRPGRLAAGEPDLQPVWRQIGDLLADDAREHPGPATLADVGGVTLDNPHLRAAVDLPGVTTTVLPAGRPHAERGPFDTVIAVGSLHRWAEPEDAARTVAALLRPGGLLVAVENTELSPLGLLVAGLLENGFADATGASVDSPTQDADTWLRLLDSAGLQAVATPVGPTPAVLIRARRTAHRSPLETPRTARPSSGPIRVGTESEIARLWAEILRTSPRDRADSFFELGGDSLRATRFIAAVQNRYGITLAMREFFARPELAAVARRIDALIAEAGDDHHEEGVL